MVPAMTALRTVKRILKPRVKLMVSPVRVNFRRVFSGEVAASPPSRMSQEGMRGSTQGDKKESSPAAKAKKGERSLSILIVY
jgi:hypothetical protein